ALVAFFFAGAQFFWRRMGVNTFIPAGWGFPYPFGLFAAVDGGVGGLTVCGVVGADFNLGLVMVGGRKFYDGFLAAFHR
ncbi:hypothetical protein ACQWFX_26560, partial [Salmonella enterica subsp. enterica serovar Infantis]